MRTMTTMLRSLALTLTVLCAWGGSVLAAGAVSPELAAKTEMVRAQMQQRVSDEERAAAAAALKALREKVYAAKQEAAQQQADPTKRTKGGSTVSTQGISGIDFKPIPTGPFEADGTTPSTPDYYTTANWANTPPLAKFVDSLPGLGAANANLLGQYLTVAKPDTTTYPGSDYYEIDLVEYRQQMHSDLPDTPDPTRGGMKGTLLRGYVQVNTGTNLSANTLPSQNKCGVDEHACTEADTNVAPDPVRYLGPTIVSERDRPVRIKFRNRLPAGDGGDLFIPVDTSVMGAGTGPAKQGTTDPRGVSTPCNNDSIDNPNGCDSYTENRANIHLHGGRTPWISDGTPHQWITPVEENTAFTKGVSLQNVPDMPDPGDGATTYYYTNQQSARLMFYHDHAFGITRLNVYAGEAAGYVITDQYEQDLINRGLVPKDQIPLIIQDKTFVDAELVTHPITGEPNVPKIRVTDPLWNWGSGPLTGNVRQPVTGDLWLPHVYMPAQTSVAGFGGVNPFGRWMYGPWFYPATVVEKGPVANPYYDPDCSSTVPYILADCQTPGQPVQIPGTPNTSMGMEAFQDSAVVNGTAFPTLTVDPRAYRFRILNAASDRFQNLSFYVADSTPTNVSPDGRLNAPYRSNRTEVKMLPASIDLAQQQGWPENWPVDGRDGGVPDPATRGPGMLQIGTEGGFLPKPVMREPQPVTYMTDPTAFWVGVVDKTGLALGPAERADVIVDFSNYAGQTLILYNDAPAAWPARVAGYDYFTGAPDMRDSGGYGAGGTYNPVTGVFDGGHGILPGYAPNTRTVMQVIVTGGTSGLGSVDEPYSFDPIALHAEFDPASPATPSLFAKAQEPIIVGQAAYQDIYPNSFFPTAFPWEGISQINDQTINFVTVDNTVANPKHVVAVQEPKGIHDEMGASFDPIYGRMSGNLAMQLPNPTTLNALLVLYGFSDLPTEVIDNSTELNVSIVPGTTTLADGTQIWKISHNGVDTHPIHFHIFDVQLVNRVGWDGQILLPEENELGWKDTIKISPLMDTIVAVRPRAPALPFGITNSLRPLNPAIPIGSGMGFNSVDWMTGQARNPAVTNILYNFGWEYVWHCHILSHEEMDMMRPIVVNVTTANVSDIFSGAGPATLPAIGVDVTWTDPTPVNYVTRAGFGESQNEIGFNIWRSVDGGPLTKVGSALANKTTFNDPDGLDLPTYNYVIEAYNASGSTFSDTPGDVTLNVYGGPAAPANLDLTATIGAPLDQSVTSVTYYNGTNVIGTSTTGPDFLFTWAGVPAGTYIVKAVATATLLDAASKPVTLTKASLTQPVVLTNTMIVTATANNGELINVCDSITLDSTVSEATPPLTYAWNVDGVLFNTADVTLPVPVVGHIGGAHSATLTVTDSSAPPQVQTITVPFTVINTPPTAIAKVTEPLVPYAINFGEILTLDAFGEDTANLCNTLSYAWDIDGNKTYDYFTQNRSIKYTVLQPWLGAGEHTITLKVADSSGESTIATALLTVGPPPNADAPATITVPANTSTGTYTVFWAPAAIAGATYTLEESTDNFATSTVVASGLTTTSKLITGKTDGLYEYRVQTVAVATVTSPWTTGNNPCAVLLTTVISPAVGTTFNPGQTVNVVGSATTPGTYTVASMAFFDAGVLIGTDSDGAPYTVSYNPTSLGTHNLTATTTYVGGATSPSAQVAITIAGPQVPTLTSSSAVYDLGDTITLNVTPAAVIGVVPTPTVSAVAFYEGTTPLGFDDTAPYSLAWVPATGGAKSVTAAAIYSNGMSATSAVLPLTVNGTVAAPSLVSVPTSSTTGNYEVSWTEAALPTAGASYTLEESTDNFVNPVNTTVIGTGLPGTSSAQITSKNGEAFYYRVTASKPPMASSTTTGNNGCAVALFRITTTSLATGSVNTAYNRTVAAINGSSPYTWSATGLPANLTINPTTGAITGTPAPSAVTSGAYTIHPIVITAQASAPSTVSATASLNLRINQTAPAAPSGLSASSPISTRVVLTWTDNANNESGFNVQRAADPGFTTGLTSSTFYSVNLTTYTDTTVVAGTTYYYRVRAVNSYSPSPSFSNEVSVTTPISQVSITTNALANGVVNATYNQTVAATAGTLPYIWSATGLPANLTINPTTGAITGTPAPSTVPTGTYAIFPVSITVRDSAAVPTTATASLNLRINQAAPAAPSGLSASAPISTQVVLTWTDNANNESGFNVQRATDAGFTTGLTSRTLYAVNLTTYTDTTVVAGTTYYYRVRAVNSYSPSPSFSNEVPVTTP